LCFVLWALCCSFLSIKIYVCTWVDLLFVNTMLSQPHLERVWGWNSHSRNGDLGVLRDFWNFKVQLQGSKHLALGFSLHHWKAIKVWMSKMGTHGPFGHLQHKLWQKEGSGVKLTIWLPTTKSRESTQPRCVQMKCDTPLESSQG
jgi:hypothetical protein